MFCMNCGRSIPDDARFCMYCGTRMGEMGVQLPPGPEDAAARRQEAAGGCLNSVRRNLFSCIPDMGVIAAEDDGLVFLAKGAKRPRKVVTVRGCRDKLLLVGACGGKAYYTYSREEGLSGQVVYYYASYDPAKGESELLVKTEDPDYGLEFDKYSPPVAQGDKAYAIAPGREALLILDLPTGDAEEDSLPAAYGRDYPQDWKLDLGRSRGLDAVEAEVNRTWMGLSVFGDYAYTGLDGAADHMIRFPLDDPRRFEYLPYTKGVTAIRAMNLLDECGEDKLIGASDTYGGNIMLLPTQPEFGRPLMSQWNGELRSWWKCSGVYVLAGSGRRADLVDLKTSKVFRWEEIPGALDYIPLPDGGVLLYADDNCLYRLPFSFLETPSRTLRLDWEIYRLANMSDYK